MNPLLQLAHHARRAVYRLLRVRTVGVKVMLFDGEGRLLLVRNSYGKTQQHLLPGGGVKRREAPAAAAAREVREEVGVEAAELTLFGIYVSELEGRRDTIHLFTARTRDKAEADGVEVSEARFFPLDALPETMSAATARRIAEYRRDQPVSPRW